MPDGGTIAQGYAPNGTIAGSSKAAPNYGPRQDGTPKYTGFLGPLKNKRGEVMTEYSIGVELDGKEVEIPTLVPTLSKSEISTILNTGKITKSIEKKAVLHAIDRMRVGKSPFYGPDDETGQ